MKTLEERFWEKVDKKSDDECWEWKGATNGVGYGVGYYNKKIEYAHRIAWMIKNNEIKDNLFVCHHCDNKICVNPKHLFLGTHSDNMRDRNKKGRGNIREGEQCSHSKLRSSDVSEIRSVYKNKLFSQYELANIFGVHVMTINNAISRKTWKCVN